jgi:uncharacterized membrane protein YuzA (DUF378 family)
MKLSTLDWIALILVIVGGLNWGLIGIIGFNLVDSIFGMGLIANIVYVLVGLSALWLIVISAKLQKKGGMSMPSGQM